MRVAPTPPADDAYTRAVERLLTRLRTALPPDAESNDADTRHALACQESLRTFVEQAWPYVEPKKPFVGNWHIDVLCELLERVTRGEIKRLLINVPPGTMKSLLVSVFWPAWEWMRFPELRYLTASYSGHLTVRDNVKVRSIVQSEWYQRYFNVTLVDDQNQKTYFKNSHGGWRIATSVNGPGTGEHPDRIIIDDPLTAEEARSAQERTNAIAWFDGTISTRGVTRDTAIIVIMQRLHEEDLSGHLLERGGWMHVCWPMRYVTTRANQPTWKPDPLDQRTDEGELLWPDLFTEEKVRQLELDLGPYSTAGQLQQSPSPEGGGLFKREWFKFVDVAPVIARRARGWDTAGTEGGGDWTAGVKIAEACGLVTDPLTKIQQMGGLGLFYVENVKRGQLSPAGVNSLMLQTAKSDGIGCSQREEKEGGASGKAVIDARAKALVGYDYKGVPISGDKVTRSKPFRAQVEAGNVFIVRTGDELRDAWIEPYLSELSTFPTGKHDDQVDGSSAAFNAVLLEEPPSDDALAGKATW